MKDSESLLSAEFNLTASFTQTLENAEVVDAGFAACDQCQSQVTGTSTDGVEREQPPRRGGQIQSALSQPDGLCPLIL